MSTRRQQNPRQADPGSDATPVELSEEEARPLLESGEVVGGHRIRWGSNYTFLVRIDAGPGKYLRGIYKPRDGERPLYDFPGGSLYKREYATFVLSRALGWPNVPLTLIREGPYGVGSMQLFVENDPRVTYFELLEDRTEELLRIAVFDLLVNNADRKAGHCLLGSDGRVWSIDHGLTFHPVMKLRSVMLEFWGQPIPTLLREDLRGLLERAEADDALLRKVSKVLAPVEMHALTERLRRILDEPALPVLDPYLNVPYPWV